MNTSVIAIFLAILIVLWLLEKRVKTRRADRARDGWLDRQAARQAWNKRYETS